MTNRRFVIDEEAGSVSVFLWFNGENGMADSHEFRVEGGKLRYVHAIMVPGAAKGKSGKGLAGKGFAGKGM